MLFVSIGGFFFVDTAAQPLGSPEQGGGGTRVAVVEGVEIELLPGWQEAERFTDPPGVRLTRGIGSLDAFAIDFAGTPDALFESYFVEALEPQSSQLQRPVTVEPLSIEGASAVRGPYTGSFGDLGPVEGEVTALVTPEGTGVVFDGWAHQGLYAQIAEEVRVMVEGVGLG